MATPDYVQRAVVGLQAPKEDYDVAEQFYLGTRQEIITSPRLRQMFGDTYQTFRINYARTPVDVLLERVQVQGIVGANAEAVRIAQQVWNDNELGIEAKDLHRMVFEFGDAYIIGWPDETMAGGVSLYSHDPRNVRVFYNVSRPRVKDYAVHSWIEAVESTASTPRRRMRVNLYYPDHVEQWVSQTVTENAPSDMLKTLAPYEDEDSPHMVENPVDGVVPVFHFRNGRPYGRPEHADAFGPQDILNKLLVTMAVAVDYAGYPQRYVLTESALDSTEQPDAFDEALPTDADYQGLDPDSSMEAGPGSTWLLSGSKLSVGQFPAAETKNFLDAVHSIVRQMAAVCDVPLGYFDRSGQQPSGDSFRMSEKPLNNKRDDRQAILGVTWNELFNYCAAVNGVAPSDVGVTWAPGRLADDKDAWETAGLQITAGVPREQVMVERGYSPEVVASWPLTVSDDTVLDASEGR